MKIKFTSIFSAASLFLGLQTQVASAQCDTVIIAGDLTICEGDTTLLSTTPTNVWNQVASFNTNFAEGVGFSIGNKGYAGLGTAGNAFWEYDQATDAWSQKANFIDSRFVPAGFSIGNKGYVASGVIIINSARFLQSDLWEYDPIVNTWTQKANYPGLPAAAPTGFSIGTKGYVGGGLDIDIQGNVTGFLSEFWQYNPANDTWLQKASIGTCYYTQSFNFNGNGYVAFAQNLLKYDTLNNAWSSIAFPGLFPDIQLGELGSMTAFRIGNYAFVGLPGVDFWQYDLVNNSWTEVAHFSQGSDKRITASSFVIGNKGYVVGGYNDNNSSTNQVFEYVPSASYSWSTGDTTQSIVVDSAGVYTLNMTFPITGCPASSATVTVVNTTPSITFTGNDSICSGTSTTITAAGGASFVWSTGDSIASITLSPMNDSTYYVTVADTNGCSATDSITVFVSVCSGINELGANQNISLYPNPASSLVKVSTTGALLETIKIYNLAGALVYEQVASKSEEVLNINIPAGVYYMHLKTDAGTNIKKFVVQ